MSKRQFLEKMIENLIENDVDSARANFHQFVVESAREIHSSLIETDELENDLDDADGENNENGEKVEESFEMFEDGEGDIGADIGSDGSMGGSAGGDDTGGDDSDDGEEVDPDHDGDDDSAGDHIEVSIEDFDDLKAELAALQAKFDSLNPEAGEGEEAGEEGFGGDEEGFHGPAEEVGFGDEEGMEEGFDLTEEDLLGLEESWSEVSVKMDGGELDGKFATPEKSVKTPIADKTEDSVKAADMVSKKDNHKGYEREAAPSVAPAKTHATNTMTSGKKAWSGVTAKMDGQEQGGGKFATPEKSKTTPVATKK